MRVLKQLIIVNNNYKRDNIMSYRAPTFIEARQILKALELTGSQVANMCGMKNSRQVRKYTSQGLENNDIPYSVLFTIVAKNIGVFIGVDNWRDQLVENNILVDHKKLDYMSEEAQLQQQYKI